MTPAEMRMCLSKMQSDTNVLTLSSIGMNNAITHLLCMLNHNCMFSMQDIVDAVGDLSSSIELFTSSLDDFYEDAQPFINGGD